MPLSDGLLSRSRHEHRQNEIRSASDSYTKKPAVNAPPRRQHVGEVRQDAGEQGANTSGDEGSDVEAAPVPVLAALDVERIDIDLALGDQIIVHQDYAQ